MKNYDAEFIKELRNDFPIIFLLDVLKIETKMSEGYLRFLCHRCREFNSAVYEENNIAYCFCCKKGHNPIDLVIATEKIPFKKAVDFLKKSKPRGIDRKAVIDQLLKKMCVNN